MSALKTQLFILQTAEPGLGCKSTVNSFQHESANRVVKISLKVITVHKFNESIIKPYDVGNAGRIALVAEIKVFSLFA
jgi:hypothetical protein